MRPQFAIYFAALLTFGMAIFGAVGEGMAARKCEALMSLVRPGENGSPLVEAANLHYSQLSFFALFAVLQVVILVYTRRLARKPDVANSTL